MHERLSRPRLRRSVRLILLVWVGAVAAGAAIGAALHGTLTPVALRDWVESLGPGGPALFVLLSALAPLVFVPVAPLTIASAVLFPWPWSLVWTVAARNTSANLGFWIARRLGSERARKLMGDDLEDRARRLRRRGLPAVFVLRILPVAPFTAVSFAAGVSGMRWRDYALGCFVGMLPGSAVTLSALGLALG